MSDKPQAPVRICRPNKPLTLEPYDGMRDPYTGDVYRIVNNKLVLEPAIHSTKEKVARVR